MEEEIRELGGGDVSSVNEQAWYLKGFRKARRRSPVWNLGKTAAQVVLFWLLFLFLIPWQLVAVDVWAGWRFGFAGQAWLPWVGFALLGGLGLWSGATMAYYGEGTPLPLDFPNELVVRGPYRFVRNPMAIAGLSQGACVGLYLGSWVTIAYVVVGGLLWNAWVRPPEEHHLELEFGQAYREYREAVRCWIPRLRPYDAA